MCIKKILTIVIITASLAFSQDNDTTYSISTELGIGYSRYYTTMDYSDLNKNGFSGTIRVMWNPEHLLSIGLETGYQYLYSIDVSDYDTEFGTTDFSASMYTVPVFITFAMRLSPNIRLTAGTGMYLLYNSGNLFEDPLESNQISIGGHGGLSYTYPISNSISIGGELLYSFFSKIDDHTIAIQFLFMYDFLKY
jgi:hypothetical protein